jgi:hypothetical protein
LGSCLKIGTQKKVQTQVGELVVKKDHLLAPKGSFRQSAYLQESALLLGQGHVYAESSQLLKRLCGVDLSGKQIENLCHYYGQAIEDKCIDKEVVEKVESLHYAMVDGSYILSREDGWRETKVGRVFKASDNFSISDKRVIIKESNYVAYVGEHTDFIEKMTPLLNCLTCLVFIADGAPWIWRWITDNYPNAIQILDFYHAFEKICQWATIIFKDKEELDTWCQQAKELLLNDEIKEVIIQIQNIDCQGDRLEKKNALLTYLDNNLHRMTYKTFSDKGYLIGSGAIESAQRTVVQQRLKLSGQRWTLNGAQQVLNLRTKNLSNQWDEVIQLVRMAA